MSFPDSPICPSCEAVMEQGFIVAIGGIHWSPDETTGRMFVPTVNTDTMYPGNEGAFLQTPRYVSARCRKCGLALLEYRE